jgi:DNA-binding CsgD family transcriptional regulator/tetratricopeptide (TPR) repeat protein
VGRTAVTVTPFPGRQKHVCCCDPELRYPRHLAQANDLLSWPSAGSVVRAETEEFPGLLLEREAERLTLASAVRDAAGGRGGLVIIRGPAGIGKSRLIAEVDGLALRAEVTRLDARGTEMEREFAFGGVRQIFSAVLATEKAGQRSGLFRGAASHAAPVFFEEGPSGAGPPGVDEAILDGLYWLVADLAARRPLVITVDDAHWLDAPTLRWLAYLANRVEGSSLALIVAMRPYDPRADQELLDQLAAHPTAELLRPQPLSADAVGAFADAALQQECPATVKAALAQSTAGNPFYVNEMLRSILADEGPGLSADAESVVATPPPSVAESVRRRLSRLAPPCTSLSAAIAILGESWSARLAAGLAGLDEPSAILAAEELIRADILAPGGRAFIHPLVRAVTYEAIPTLERQRLHREAAALLTDRGADAEQVALQLVSCEPNHSASARRQLREAAHAAWARGAPDIAATFSRRALEEGAEGDERIGLLRDLGLAELSSRGMPGIAFLRQALEETDDRATRAEIALELGRALSGQGYHADAMDVFEQGRREASGEDPALAAELDERIALLAPVNLKVLLRMGGLPGVEQLANARRGSHSRLALGWAMVAMRPPASRGAELIEETIAAGFSVDEETALGAAGVALMAAGQLERAKAVWDQAIATARTQGALAALRSGLALRSPILVRLGQIVEAEADLRQLIEWSSGAGFSMAQIQQSIPWVLSPLLDVLVERDQLDEAQGWLEFSGLEGELPELHGFNYLLDSLGRFRTAQGRLPEAISSLRECGRRQEAWGISNPGFMAWRAHLAMALASAGHAEEARELADREAELARAFGVGRELGIAMRAQAVVRGGADGIDLLREAAAQLSTLPVPIEQAKALVALGSLLHGEGFGTDARPPLRAGLDLAERCGGLALAKRGREALIATGAKPRRPAVSGVESLTASELRVARMAASGMTNREIAENLFVTEKTVEAHLGGSYRKLSISSRSQLPDVLGDGNSSADA